MEVIKRVGAGALLITVLSAAGVMFPSSASVLVPPAYNLVQNNGTPLTRRTTLNCTTGMTCSDSGGVTTMAATGTGGSVTSVQVAANAPLSVGGTCTVTTRNRAIRVQHYPAHRTLMGTTPEPQLRSTSGNGARTITNRFRLHRSAMLRGAAQPHYPMRTS